MLSTETAKGGQAVNSERVKRVRRMSLFVVLILLLFYEKGTICQQSRYLETENLQSPLPCCVTEGFKGISYSFVLQS